MSSSTPKADSFQVQPYLLDEYRFRPGGDEFSDIDIRVWNKDSLKEAPKDAKAFVQWLRPQSRPKAQTPEPLKIA